MCQNELVLLESVTVEYEGEEKVPVRALNGIDLAIREGEWLSVVGANGSGKSTLVQTIAGLCSVSEGTVRRIYAPGSCALVMQHPEAQIVGETVAEEIQFVLENHGIVPEDMDARMIESLTRVGLDVDPDQPTADLSGGQKQLLAIAGSLAAGASLLLFDEATSMLDPESAEKVLQTVTGLHRSGTTVVWVTQNMDEVGCGGRVAAMENGNLVYDGNSGFFLYGPVWEPPVPSEDPDRSGSAEAVQAGPNGQAPCERYGYERPFTVLLVNSMLERGVSFPDLPLTMRQFAEVVRGRWT